MPYKDPQAARLASRERVRRYRKRQRIAKKLGPAAVEVTGDPADVLAAWSASTLVVPAGHPNAGEPMTLPDYGVEFLRAAAPGSSRPRASARHWPARPPTSRADTAPTSRDRPPLGDQARRMGGQTGSTRRCGPPATAYPARRGCWHHGARWTSWTSSGCRRTVGWCSLFGGRTTSPRPTARDQRRDVEKRESRGRVPRICPLMSHATVAWCRPRRAHRLEDRRQA
jgi:hypothetical protein